MKDAIDKSHIGSKEIIIDAIELAKSHQHSSNIHARRFFCPICREPVQFIYTKKVIPYFKHTRDSIIAKECDRFSSTIDPNNPLYSKKASQLFVGNPLYIQKSGESFGFFIGLPALSEDIINAEVKQNVLIQNQAGNPLGGFRISSLIPNEISYRQLKTLSGVYILSYSNQSSTLEKIWKQKTFGIQDEGAIFSFNSNYCKKIAINGNVMCDTEYYLIAPEDKKIDGKDFLSVTESWPLDVFSNGYKKWFVNKIMFTEFNQEAWDFALDLQVNLIEKPAGIVPLWPPHQQIRNQHKYKDARGLAIFLVDSNDPECKCMAYTGDGNTTYMGKEKIALCNLITTKISDKSTYLSLDGKQNSSDIEIFAKKDALLSTYKSPSIKISYNNIEITDEISDNIYWIKNGLLRFESDCKCNISIINNDKSMTIIWNVNEQVIPSREIAIDSKIIINHGSDIIKTLKFKKKIIVKNSSLLPEEFILDKLPSLSRSKKDVINTPSNLRYILFRIKKYPTLSKYIRYHVITGTIPRKAYELILESYSTLVVKK